MLRYFMLFALVLYVWHPHFFERYFFLNECLSLYGFCIFWINRRTFLRDEIVHTVLPFLSLVLLFWLGSLLVYENLYILLRRLSIFYSFFVFFSFYYLYLFVKRSKVKWLWLIAMQKVNLVFCYMYLATQLSKGRNSFWLISALFIISYTLLFGGSTGFFSLIITFFIFFTDKKQKIFSLIFILKVIFILYFFKRGDFIESNGYFYNIYELMDAYALLALDGNITVRIFMWKQVMFEILPASNFLGIGFGTVLFNEQFIYFIGLRSQLDNNELLAFTLSPHNSFIYIAATMGLPGVAAIVYMYHKLIVNYRMRYIKGLSSIRERQIFMIFVAYSIAAAMNVVIESPIHSGLFWGILGVYLFEQKNADTRS